MKVAFLSVFAFDANISLINVLKEKCDITFYSEALHEVYNYIDKNQLEQLFTTGTHVKQIQRFGNLIPLDKTIIIKGCKMSSIFKKIYNSFRIDALLKKDNPDIIVIDNVTLTYLISVIRLRKKTLLIVHDQFQHSGEEFIVQKYLRKLFFRMIPNKLVLNNNQKEKFITENKLNKKNVHSSFLSVYEYLTYYSNSQSISNYSGFNILFFGRISPYKGIQFLLETFMDIISNYPDIDITLTIAGSGAFDFDINQYIKNSKISIINKFVAPEELSDLISKAAVVVCPYTDGTQSGVIMSAYAFRKPVIATNVGGLPEMVDHEKTGLIIEKNNKEQLKNAIMSLYQDRSILKRMSGNINQVYFEGNKSWKKAGELIYNVFLKMHKEH